MDRSDTPNAQPGSIRAEIDALLASGLFQPHWYTAQCGDYFRTHRSAAKHFVQQGMAKLCSPHVLLMPQIWPSDMQEAWRRGEVTTVLQLLRDDPTRQPPLGPLFYPHKFNADPTLVAQHPGGSLGHFLSIAEDDDELPTPLTTARLGDVRSTWQPTIERIKTQNKLVRYRTSTTWPHERETAWRASLGAAPTWQSVDGAHPLFSIIMPADNRSELMSRAVRSVVAQACPAWELLIIDTGAEPSTTQAVETLALSDPRIAVIRTEHVHATATRNCALAAACGEYVAFLDGDRVWQADYLELMAAGMRAENAVAACSGLELRNDSHVEYHIFDGGVDNLLAFNHVDLNVMVVTRQLAQSLLFATDLGNWAGHDFAIRVAKQTEIHPMPFVGCIYDARDRATVRSSKGELETSQWVVLGRHLIDWEVATQAERVPGRVSVIIPVYQDWRLTQKAVSSVLDYSDEHDVEVVIVDNGSRALVGSTLEQLYSSETRVMYHRLPRNLNFGLGSNYGVTVSSGEFVCFLNNDTQVRPGWLDGLLPELARSEVRGVQPLLVYPDESIQTAGTVFVARDSIPCHFLTGLPPEDAATTAGERFSAVTAACLVMRSDDILEVKGFDPQYVNGMEDVDLCLRSIEKLGGWFVVNPAVRVTHHESKTPGRSEARSENRRLLRQRWAGRWPDLDTHKFTKAGLQIAALGGDVDWVPQPKPTIVRVPNAMKLRWGIRLASTGGERGNHWGDTFYAESLATALRAQGQEVVTYRHGANTRVHDSLDDVNLVLRGLDAVPPIPGAVNILWVISHPTKVTLSELEAFDLVYAASLEWPRRMSPISGRPVYPLLQATDTRIFHPPADDSRIRRRLPTFVGSNFRRRSRQVVADLLAQRIDFRVIGAGWEELPDGIWEREWVENAALGEVYREASIVLADHWPDMADLGFLQNRIFDAVACATPVIVDSATGIAETFGSLVQTYDTPETLRRLFDPDFNSVFGTPEERRRQANHVMARHSFDARATELIQAVQPYHTAVESRGPTMCNDRHS